MHTLWYHTSCPLCRQLKSLMDAIQVNYELKSVEFWAASNPLCDITPLACPPVLQRKDFGAIDGIYAIVEYLFTVYPNFHLFPRGIKLMSEARSALYLINEKFYSQVSKRLVHEKFIKCLTVATSPDRKSLAIAGQRQDEYLLYFSSLVREKSFVLYDKLSIADIALAAHISILDYFGNLDWYKYPALKVWYRVVKSLPYFRHLLKERIGSFAPPTHYQELDF
jgi:glutathione S-transferase